MRSQVRILVVDDDPDMRFIMVRALEKLGYQVEAVEDGLTAIKATASQKFHLALVDIKMPGMGGLETIKAIRQISPQMPILIVTGSPDWPDPQLRAATQGCIYKPFRLEQLRSTVEKILEGLP